MLRAVFFDLDGTLLPMDENLFVNSYFGLLYQKIKDHGYEKETLISTIWKGTKAMYANTGEKSNEEAFWQVFENVYGKEKLKDKFLFDEFYANEFNNVKDICEDNPLAKKIVKYAKDKVGTVILSTNPIFPRLATIERASFVGLGENDFDYITSYEDCFHAKPNPEYFKDILKKFNLQPNEVILFGNNDYEDYACAKACGIDCYLVGDHIIEHKDMNITYPKIRMDEVIQVIDREMQKRK